MEKVVLVSVACISLAAVNVVAFRCLGIFGLFVTAASVPFANKILDIIAVLK